MDEQKRNSKAIFLWTGLVVSLILALGLVVSSFLVIKGVVTIKSSNFITVTGSAKKQIKSDLIVWRGNFTVQSPTLGAAFNTLKSDNQKVLNYLKKAGLTEKDFTVSAITTTNVYELLPNGGYSNNLIGYKLDQMVEVKSGEVDKIAEISRNSTELINDGVSFQSQPPQYYYTKIADLKISMLADATKDAKNRAEQIALNTGTKIGDLKSAKMGVFQITPQYSTEVSDSGISDISSLNKEITAVVTCDFETK
ncbi:MAG: SIMPL domain-containing protein [Bacillota bacterium]|nr:SIMPL domain-containing protein [Bacillota bacterium]